MNQSREGREKGEEGVGEAIFPAAEFKRDFDMSRMNNLNLGRDRYLDIIVELNCCPVPVVMAFMSNPLHGNSKIKHDYRNYITTVVGEAVARAWRSSPDQVQLTWLGDRTSAPPYPDRGLLIP